MSISVKELQELAGHGRVVTDQGEKVGPIGQIYLDDVTDIPDWVTVRTGLFGTSETFVPLDTARIDGNDLVVAHAREIIRDAPRVEVDGSLSPEEEQVLYRHYGIGVSDGLTRADGEASGARHERSGPDADAAMIRSEERLLVATQQRESGRARLRKYVVTERVTQTVPVRHEEARVTREPITDADVSVATTGSAFTEEVFDIVLHAEVPVVEKTVVPVERVRLDTVTVSGQKKVSADLRSEHIELDDLTSAAEHTAATLDTTPAAARTPSTPKNPPSLRKSPSKGKKGTRRRR